MILGRLVPVIRTFVPVVAGMTQNRIIIVTVFLISLVLLFGLEEFPSIGYYTLVNIFYWLLYFIGCIDYYFYVFIWYLVHYKKKSFF